MTNTLIKKFRARVKVTRIISFSKSLTRYGLSSKLRFVKPFALSKSEIQSKLAAYFQNRKEIIFAYLFGSFAKDRQTFLSDLDVAVYLDYNQIDETKYPYGYESSLASELMGFLDTPKLDIVLINHAPPLLAHRIFSTGIKIFDRSPQTEKKVFVQNFNAYIDTEPLRRVQAYYMKRYLKSLPSAAHG